MTGRATCRKAALAMGDTRHCGSRCGSCGARLASLAALYGPGCSHGPASGSRVAAAIFDAGGIVPGSGPALCDSTP